MPRDESHGSKVYPIPEAAENVDEFAFSCTDTESTLYSSETSSLSHTQGGRYMEVHQNDSSLSLSTDAQNIDVTLSPTICAKTRKAASIIFSRIPNFEGHYEFLSRVGEGSYGLVALLHAKTETAKQLSKSGDSHYALKYFKDLVDKATFFSEVERLTLLGGKENVVALHLAVWHKRCAFFIMSYIESTKLRMYIKEMEIEEIKLYMFNLLKALKYIHSKGIIHCDVKPGNFLYDRSQKKFLLIDFGSATDAKESSAPHSVHGTRGFLSPEVLLGQQKQTTAIDMWAAGVIFLSLLSKKYPFFQVIWNDDLGELIKVFGTARLSLYARLNGLEFGPRPMKLSSDLRLVCEEILHEQIPNAGLNPEVSKTYPPAAYDLLEKMLEIDPKDRISAFDSLEHPFLRGFEL